MSARCNDCNTDSQTTNLLSYKDFHGTRLSLCYMHYKKRVKEDIKEMRKCVTKSNIT